MISKLEKGWRICKHHLVSLGGRKGAMYFIFPMRRLNTSESWQPREAPNPPGPLGSALLDPRLPTPTPQASCQRLTRQPGTETPLLGGKNRLSCHISLDNFGRVPAQREIFPPTPCGKSQWDRVLLHITFVSAPAHLLLMCFSPLKVGKEGIFRLLFIIVRLRNELYIMCYVCNRKLLPVFMAIQEVRREGKKKIAYRKAPCSRNKTGAFIFKTQNTFHTGFFLIKPLQCQLLTLSSRGQQVWGILHVPARLVSGINCGSGIN